MSKRYWIDDDCNVRDSMRDDKIVGEIHKDDAFPYKKEANNDRA